MCRRPVLQMLWMRSPDEEFSNWFRLSRYRFLFGVVDAPTGINILTFLTRLFVCSPHQSNTTTRESHSFKKSFNDLRVKFYKLLLLLRCRCVRCLSRMAEETTERFIVDVTLHRGEDYRVLSEHLATIWSMFWSHRALFCCYEGWISGIESWIFCAVFVINCDRLVSNNYASKIKLLSTERSTRSLLTSRLSG